MKTIISSYDDISIKAAQQIKNYLLEKPDSVLALASGRTPIGLYTELARMCAEKELSFENAKIFAITEYAGETCINSCRAVLEDSLLKNTDVKRENCFFPSYENYGKYDEYIECAGGIDIAVLGIGVNSHIGFNEPAVAFDSHTHIQKLTDATKRQNSELFGGVENVPEYAVTMGIKTIITSRKILIVASGGEKADAVFRMVYGKTESYTPASFLQIPADVTAYIDAAAAIKL